MNGWTQVAGEVELLATFFSALVFIAAYSLLAPWWRYSIGRTIVALDAAVALTLLPQTLHMLFGVHVLSDIRWAWFTLVTFGAVPVVILWRLWIFWRIQRRGGDIN